jgi:hypothetical protein
MAAPTPTNELSLLSGNAALRSITNVASTTSEMQSKRACPQPEAALPPTLASHTTATSAGPALGLS